MTHITVDATHVFCPAEVEENDSDIQAAVRQLARMLSEYINENAPRFYLEQGSPEAASSIAFRELSTTGGQHADALITIEFPDRGLGFNERNAVRSFIERDVVPKWCSDVTGYVRISIELRCTWTTQQSLTIESSGRVYDRH